jgi:hypothetical protein
LSPAIAEITCLNEFRRIVTPAGSSEVR